MSDIQNEAVDTVFTETHLCWTSEADHLIEQGSFFLARPSGRAVGGAVGCTLPGSPSS